MKSNKSYAMKEGQSIFDYRYIQRNARMFSKRTDCSQSLASLYFRIRKILGKVDIPQFDLVLTTRCNLNCESCNNLMQYFRSSPSKHFKTDFVTISNTLDTLLNKVDSVQNIYVLGGEPFLSKDLPEVLKYLGSKEKIKKVVIVTNGTIKVSQEIASIIRSYDKITVEISDYSSSPNLTKKLYHKELLSMGIKAVLRKWPWFNIGAKFKRNRSREGIIKNFRDCALPCCQLLPGIGFFVCPISAGIAKLKGLKEVEGDYLKIDGNLTKKKILDFYSKDFIKSCDYCPDMGEEKYEIPVGLQTKDIYKL